MIPAFPRFVYVVTPQQCQRRFTIDPLIGLATFALAFQTRFVFLQLRSQTTRNLRLLVFGT